MEPETIVTYRCCMCPQQNNTSNICPAKGVLHPVESPCRFVRQFVDSRGWRYRVMGGIGLNTFKARYNKPGTSIWKDLACVDWCDTFDQAQGLLNELAQAKGWRDTEEMQFVEEVAI